MKKALAFLMAATMAAGAFTACGKKDSEEKETAASEGQKIAEKFAECYYSLDGAEDYYNFIYTDYQLDYLEEHDYLEDYIDDRNDSNEDYYEDYKIKVKSVKEKEKFDKKALEAAENYFEQQASYYTSYDDDDEIEYTAKSGYEYKVKVEMIEGEGKDREKDTTTLEFCAIELEDDGWKIINYTDMDYLVDNYGDDDDDDDDDRDKKHKDDDDDDDSPFGNF